MQNPKFYIGSNFDNLYFHTISWVKSKNYHKIKCDKSLKSYDNAENTCLEINLTNYTFMQNLRLKGKQQQKTRVVVH